MKKKNYIYLTGTILIILLVILAIYVAFYCLNKNPKIIIKRSINTVMTTLEMSVKKDEDNSLLNSNTYEFATSLILNVDNTDMDKEKLKLNGLVDFTKKELEASLSFQEDNTNIIDITYLLKDTNKYIKSDTLFSNIYNIDNYTCENEILCKILNYDYFSLNNDKDIILSDILKDIKNVLTDNISDNNTELVIDKDNELDIYKYTITKEDLESMYNNLTDANKDIVSSILNYLYDGATKEEILNDFNTFYIEICFKENTKDFEKLNIYDDAKEFSFTTDKDGDGKINIPELNLEGTFSKDSFIINVLDEYYLKGTISNEDDKLDVKYTLDLGFIILKGNVTNKTNVNDGYLNGNLDVTTEGSIYVITDNYKFNAGINIDYNLSKDISSSFTNIENSLDINDWTSQDEDKYNDAMNNLCNTYIGSFVCSNEEVDDNTSFLVFKKISYLYR